MSMFFRLLFLSITIVVMFAVVPAAVYAETWKVQIPAGSSVPESPVHFTPSEISVRFGDRVEWGNADSVAHTVTSGTLESGITPIFDSGHMGPGSRFSVLFSEKDAGEIKYFCTIHPWMIGIVNVVNLAADYQVFHNVGSEFSESPVDLVYKVQRNLVEVNVDPIRNSITFSFVGKIDNDKFVVYLPEELIKNPQSVFVDDKQITNYELTKTDGITILTVVLRGTAEQVKVVGVEVIGTSDPKKHVLINQMFGVTDKKFYESGDEIVISGEIKNPVQLYELILDVIAPQGHTVYHKVIPLVDSTKFSEKVPTSGLFRDFGKYMVKITGPSAKSLFLPFDFGIAPKEFNSPLKQMRTGTEPGDVVCNEGLEIFMKNSNGQAVCLTESTATILMQRGWADYF
ncbi:cupredoxin domain-containing protein [Nitrosopumilus ureiphilus]|nr:plastocyanin/azurin family copper-binding protein [Nitrosopumilus ureiphilus]